MPPPNPAELPVTVQLTILTTEVEPNVGATPIPPPKPPLLEVLPVMVLLMTLRVPLVLEMPPPNPPGLF